MYLFIVLLSYLRQIVNDKLETFRINVSQCAMCDATPLISLIRTFLSACICRAACQLNGLHLRFCPEMLQNFHPKVMCMYDKKRHCYATVDLAVLI